MNDVDDFYVGWQSRAPRAIGNLVCRATVLLVGLALVCGLILALAQKTIGVAVFEWGTTKTFSGILRARPYPHLLLPRPGQTQGGFSAYTLVAPFKFGLNPDSIAALDEKPVTLRGTLIYRGNQTMIEARPKSIRQASGKPGSAPGTASWVDLGHQTLVGEIVDSKCYLGVMNPGQLAPHRACAVRCISGGIPPVLLVRQPDRPPLYYLLVSSQGRPVNQQVLDMVAQPVQVSGEVSRQGQLLVLRADPATFRPVGRP